MTNGFMRSQGLGHTVAYCGDGINDIAALHAADLGIAIGATEAVVAAPVFTPVESVSGWSHRQTPSCIPSSWILQAAASCDVRSSEGIDFCSFLSSSHVGSLACSMPHVLHWSCVWVPACQVRVPHCSLPHAKLLPTSCPWSPL